MKIQMKTSKTPRIKFKLPLSSLKLFELDETDESYLFTMVVSFKDDCWNSSFFPQSLIINFQRFHRASSANAIKSEFNRNFNKLSSVETIEILIKLLED